MTIKVYLQSQKCRPVWEGVSKWEEDGPRQPALGRLGGGLPAGRIRVGHGKPAWNFRESVDTPSQTGLQKCTQWKDDAVSPLWQILWRYNIFENIFSKIRILYNYSCKRYGQLYHFRALLSINSVGIRWGRFATKKFEIHVKMDKLFEVTSMIRGTLNG